MGTVTGLQRSFQKEALRRGHGRLLGQHQVLRAEPRESPEGSRCPSGAQRGRDLCFPGALQTGLGTEPVGVGACGGLGGVRSRWTRSVFRRGNVRVRPEAGMVQAHVGFLVRAAGPSPSRAKVLQETGCVWTRAP